MQKIKIITDSTCDLPNNIVKELNIDVIPLKIHMGEEHYTAGVDISSEEFYQKMISLKESPSTSPPTPANFFEVYENASRDYEIIISIHISKLMSETIISAEKARNMLPFRNIKIYDAKTTGASLGQVVVEAAKLAIEEKNINVVYEVVEKTIEKVRVVGFPKTLNYLIKGGRIGKARGLIGKLFGRIPILTVTKGETSSITTIQGIDNAMNWMVNYLKEEGLNNTSKIAITHGNIPSIAEDFIQRIETTFHCYPQFIGLVGPVVGTHLGPGSIFFSYIKK